MNDSCVIGFGVVGQATAKAFGITKYFSRSESNITLNEAARCRFIFLSLPTPTVDGRCDTSVIEEYVKQLAGIGVSGVIVNRSTVTPGTVKNLVEKYNAPIVSNPEFLSEDTAVEDAKNPDVVVIGSDVPVWGKALRGLYEARFKSTNYFMTDTVTAETIKYGVNCLYALKVIYANELYEVCKRSGANYETVKNAMYKRKWIGNNHLDVWYKEKRGLHGKCLPKDLEAFANYSNSTLLKSAVVLNDVIKDKKL